MTSSGLTLQTWAGPIKTAASEKKPIPKTFSRPWQRQIAVDPLACPYETRQQLLVRTIVDHGEERWKVLQSTGGPEPYHRLIIPARCADWPEERLRTLGGAGCLNEVVDIATETLATDNVDYAQFSVQIGASAGQNLSHLHYHLYALEEIEWEDITEEILRNRGNTLEPLVILDKDDIVIASGGHRTGQCLFLPSRPVWFNTYFAEMVAEIVALYAEKFKSVEGLSPDFSFEFSIRRGRIVFGTLIPILNHIGTLEYMALLSPSTRRWNLAWSHEETAHYLRE